MSEKLPLTHPDRLKWFRNVNAIGAGVLFAAGVFVAPGLKEALFLAAAVNVGQAGIVEGWRQHKLHNSARPQPKAA